MRDTVPLRRVHSFTGKSAIHVPMFSLRLLLPSGSEPDASPAVALPATGLSPEAEQPAPETARRSMKLRARASREPPVIPPELLEFMSPFKRTKPIRRRRAANPADAHRKLQRLGYVATGRKAAGSAAAQLVRIGTLIHLFNAGVDATVERYDAISGRYHVHHSTGRRTWEYLHGTGSTMWDLLEEPLAADASSSASASDDAPTPKTSAQAKSEASSLPPECPICLEAVHSDRGVMPCCAKVARKACV